MHKNILNLNFKLTAAVYTLHKKLPDKKLANQTSDVF